MYYFAAWLRDCESKTVVLKQALAAIVRHDIAGQFTATSSDLILNGGSYRE